MKKVLLAGFVFAVVLAVSATAKANWISAPDDVGIVAAGSVGFVQDGNGQSMVVPVYGSGFTYWSDPGDGVVSWFATFVGDWDFFKVWGNDTITDLMINDVAYDTADFDFWNNKGHGYYANTGFSEFTVSFNIADGVTGAIGFSFFTGGDGDIGGKEAATPEPATLLILGIGAVGAGIAARRRMSK